MTENGQPDDYAQWYLAGSSPKTFTVEVMVTQEEYDTVLMARILDGKSLAGLVEAGLKRELEDLRGLPDYKAAFAVRNQREKFREMNE